MFKCLMNGLIKTVWISKKGKKAANNWKMVRGKNHEYRIKKDNCYIRGT